MNIQKFRLVTLIGLFGVVTCVYAADSLYVDPSGNVGVGTSSPTRKFQVEDVNSANIYVKNTSSTSAERTMLILQNKGKTRFMIANVEAHCAHKAKKTITDRATGTLNTGRLLPSQVAFCNVVRSVSDCSS